MIMGGRKGQSKWRMLSYCDGYFVTLTQATVTGEETQMMACEQVRGIQIE